MHTCQQTIINVCSAYCKELTTLATLILLSYAKPTYIGTTLHIFFFAILKYPHISSHKIVWHPDTNVKCLKGKHIPIALLRTSNVVIVTAGLAYTILLFSWQWLLQAPNKRIFEWVRNTIKVQFLHGSMHTTLPTDVH